MHQSLEFEDKTSYLDIQMPNMKMILFQQPSYSILSIASSGAKAYTIMTNNFLNANSLELISQNVGSITSLDHS